MWNRERRWLPALIALLIAGLLLGACGSSAPASPAGAGNRPTMLYFYTDN